VVDILGKSAGRVYPVGRLDYASEGLLLLTNDGALAERMMKAGTHMPKTYLVKVSGKPDEKRIERLRAGMVIELEDGRRVKTSPAKIRLFEDGENPWYEVVLIEGRNRQIRRMFERVGHLVEKIRRVRMGPLVLDLEPGRFRALTVKEIGQLKEAASGEGGRRAKGKIESIGGKG
jgi:23S rRNA pseudouridine2605 synthase